MNESKKYKKIGKCKICCQAVNDLKRGHIIPEWATKLGNLMSADSTLYDSSEIINLETKVSPYTEYFFCGKCEENLGVGEDELRRVFLSCNSINMNSTSKLKYQDFPIFKFETNKKHLIARALIGILFKAHLSKEKSFSKVYLSKNLFKKIQYSLQHNAPIKNMDFIVEKFFNFTENSSYLYTEFNTSIINNPLSFQSIFRIDNRYYLTLAGLRFTISFEPVADISQDSIICVIGDIKWGKPLDEDNNIYIPIVSFHPQVIHELLEDIKKYNLHGYCPCGLSWTKKGKILERRTFEECCYFTWFSALPRNAGSNVIKAHYEQEEEQHMEYMLNMPLRMPRSLFHLENN